MAPADGLLLLLDEAAGVAAGYSEMNLSCSFDTGAEFAAELRSLRERIARQEWSALGALFVIFAPGGAWDDGVGAPGPDLGNRIMAALWKMGPAAEPALLLAIRATHAEDFPDYVWLGELWDGLRQTHNPEIVRAIIACEDRSRYWAEVLDGLNWRDSGLASLRPLAVEVLVQAMLEVEVDQDTAEAAARTLLCSEPLRVALCLIDTGGDRTATGGALRCVACESGRAWVIESLAAVQFDLPSGSVLTPDYLALCVLDELELLYDQEVCERWFVPMLEDRQPACRAFAAYALAEVGVIKALPDLTRHQNDPDERVREAICHALAWMQEF